MSATLPVRAFRCCALIPTYNNPMTVAAVVEQTRQYLTDVIVVDDGSTAEGRAACQQLAERGLAHVHHRERNGGKGAAVKTGFTIARELGFTHALQIDADSQHDLSRIPEFLAHGQAQPQALILAYPEYDESVPAVRREARKFTRFWVDLETGRGVIKDSMCGFRLYPLAALDGLHIPSNRMDFDIEIAVRLAWTGLPIMNLPVAVRYLAKSEGGVSHFKPFRDSLRFSWLHSKLCTIKWTLASMRRVGLLRSEHPPKPTTWLNTAERGTVLGIRVVYWVCTLFGRGPTRFFVRAIALWYALIDRPAKRASTQWLTVVHGRPPTWWMTYAHILRFAQVAVDRIFFLRGKTAGLQVTRTGHHHLEAAIASGRSAILLGAHLGSFEAMRASGHASNVPINILGHFDNAKLVNALLQRLNPTASARVIHIDSDAVDFIFRVRDRAETGELIAILGDRVGLHEKSVTVNFFGRPARFPTGPFALAAVLKCPVLLTFGLYREPNHYDLYCEPFVDRVVLPRRDRAAHMHAIVQRFAHRLEEYCRRAPDNWFNFYDVWETESGAATRSLPADSTHDDPPDES